jgi:hypothetical protein
MGLDLQSYLTRFPEVCRAKYGRTYDLLALQHKFDYLRNGTRWLAAKDVANLFDPNQTPYSRYWAQPNEKDLDKTLSKMRIRLAPIPNDPGELIRELLGAFHNLALVSIVLRFAHPKRFGIFSTPVLNLLQIHRATSIDIYSAFCEELHEWQGHFKLPSVAAAGTALWTYDQITRLSDQSKKTLNAREQFESDLWIQRRRVALVVRPFLRNNGPLELARILLEEDPKIAGKIAAEEYERLLHLACQKFYRHKLPDKRGAAEALIERLVQDNRISLEEKAELRWIWEIRNRAVHAGESPTSEEVDLMIDRIQSVCSHWGSSKSSNPRIA